MAATYSDAYIDQGEIRILVEAQVDGSISIIPPSGAVNIRGTLSPRNGSSLAVLLPNLNYRLVLTPTEYITIAITERPSPIDGSVTFRSA